MEALQSLLDKHQTSVWRSTAASTSGRATAVRTMAARQARSSARGSCRTVATCGFQTL
jgi:hypothetical protein